jgi:hypothetical protein
MAGAAPNFENLDVAGKTGPQAVTVGAAATGLLEVTNTSTTGTSGTATTTAGAANVSLTVPDGYNTLLVTAPGSETIAGNGSDDFSATFGPNSTVTFNSHGGSGTITAQGPAEITVTNSTSDSGAQASSEVNAATGTATIAAAAATDTVLAGAASVANIAFIGSSVAASAGSGNTTLPGAAVATGTITGAVNQHVFSQDSGAGGVRAITSQITASLNGSVSGAAMPDFTTLAGANGSILHLADHTTIQLYGVTSTSPNASIAGHWA